MHDLHYVVHVLLIGRNTSSPKNACVGGYFRAGAPSALACLPRARRFSLSPATSKRLLRRLVLGTIYETHTVYTVLLMKCDIVK